MKTPGRKMKRYAIAGAGVRGLCFGQPMQRDFSDHAELVGVYDTNSLRVAAFCKMLTPPVADYTDFDRMVREARPDVLVVTTPDHTHAALVQMAFAQGLDVVLEKPMAIDEASVRRILVLEEEYDRRVRVTFNLRYASFLVHVKKVLAEADLGEIRMATLDWHLDKLHGPEYFRRWHRRLALSGGLLVHKSTHHFDLVNWLLEDEPSAVSAMGSLQVYGANGPFRGTSCRTCDHTEVCPHYSNVEAWDEPTATKMRQLYFNAEGEDGYIRDACVFDPEIDIYDTMTAMVRYRKGTQLSYSLCAYAAYEGYRLTLTGTKGRLEAGERFGGLMMKAVDKSSQIQIIRGLKREDVTVEQVDVPVDRRDHGGGDHNLLRHLLVPGTADPLRQSAGSRDGAASCLIGICANNSIRQGGGEVPIPGWWRRHRQPEDREVLS